MKEDTTAFRLQVSMIHTHFQLTIFSQASIVVTSRDDKSVLTQVSQVARTLHTVLPLASVGMVTRKT